MLFVVSLFGFIFFDSLLCICSFSDVILLFLEIIWIMNEVLLFLSF